MRRRFSRSIVLAAAILLAASHLRADDVAAYLEQHGLKSLLAVHLEQQLQTASNEERGDLVLRLAGLYAELLETTSDAAQRQNLEERSRRLLEQVPPKSADELRLALLRGSYRGAEKTAEDHRLRRAAAEDVEAARKTLADVIPQLQALRQQIKDNTELIDRRAARAAGAESIALEEQTDKARSLYSQCTFITAWALYYSAWLTGHDDQARRAEPLFAELLATESSSPTPNEVSVDLRSNEAVARSILGMGLCKSLTSSSPTAESWIRLLEHENAYAPLREQAGAWVIAIHLEHREYQDVAEELEARRGSNQPIPLVWLRLIAVSALEDPNRTKLADELVRSAVTEIAARGELEQVLDLAERYGTESLGDSGFALRYVHAVIAYQAARQAHGGEEPTFDPAHVALYTKAFQALKAAAAESDAGQYAVAAAACQRLIAWCHYFLGQFLDAKTAFESAAAALSGADAAEALWMAIVSLDRVVSAGGESAANAELRAQLASLTDRFIQQYPSNEHTPKLMLRRAVAEQEPSPEAVEELLAIPAGSDMYDTAQRRAADMLYQLFRRAGDDRRLSYAGQFLMVAVPLVGVSGREIDLAQSDGAERFLVRCRQILEVAMTEGVNRPLAARAAFEALAEAQAAGQVDTGPHRDEIDCRRVQDRLAADEWAAAATIADELWERHSNSVWARIAAREMFKHAHGLWKRSDASAEEKLRGLEHVVRHGGRVLHEFKDAADALSQPGALGYHTAVAEASMELWQSTGDDAHGKAALFLYEKLLTFKPRSATFLRATAILSEAMDDKNKALDCWRRLVAGTDAGSDQWFEAKFHQIHLLASIDPARARQVMDQHKQLNPEYGPDPWGAKLKGLDEQIPAASLISEADEINSDAPATQGDSANNDGEGNKSP